MKRFYILMMLACLFMMGCERIQPLVYNVNKSQELREYESELQAESLYQESKMQASIAESERILASEKEAEALEAGWQKKEIDREKTKVKGIYLTDITAGSALMDSIIGHIDETELNAVVIDIKNDAGKIAYEMDSALLSELGVTEHTISDIDDLMRRLKAHDIYVIARIVSFRDPYIGEVHPEWMSTLSDGSIFQDASGMAWVNPYKREYWEYLSEVLSQCAKDGFDEVQFDYVRFCTERGMEDVIYAEEDTQGLDKMQIISEFVQYISDRCAENQIFLSVDVFGTIIGSYVDASAVGQDYAVLSAAVDYMSPMIYPSHYGRGNFGIENPDTEPYGTISGALSISNRVLSGEDEALTKRVRPWLQGFTASYLQNYISYGPTELRAQIQAVYDSGHEEWLIWNASNSYDWSAFLPSNS